METNIVNESETIETATANYTELMLDVTLYSKALDENQIIDFIDSRQSDEDAIENFRSLELKWEALDLGDLNSIGTAKHIDSDAYIRCEINEDQEELMRLQLSYSLQDQGGMEYLLEEILPYIVETEDKIFGSYTLVIDGKKHITSLTLENVRRIPANTWSPV